MVMIWNYQGDPGIRSHPVVTAFGAQAMQGQLHQTLHEGRHTEACADLRYRHGFLEGWGYL